MRTGSARTAPRGSAAGTTPGAAIAEKAARNSPSLCSPRFCTWVSARHAIAPITEMFPMSKVNDALEHLRAGKARYRIVLVNDHA